MLAMQIMKRRRGAWILAAVAALLLLGATPAARSSAQSQGRSAEDLVRAFEQAFNTGDVAAMQQITASTFQARFNPGDEDSETENQAQILADVKARKSTIHFSNIRQTAPDTVEADNTIDAPQAPKLAHPLTAHDTFKIAAGQLVSLVEITSPQTKQDEAAYMAAHPELQGGGGSQPPAPAMPSTGAGAGAQAWPWPLFALAGACVALGLLLTHRLANRRG